VKKLYYLSADEIKKQLLAMIKHSKLTLKTTNEEIIPLIKENPEIYNS
jgi:hypothetical protein